MERRSGEGLGNLVVVRRGSGRGIMKASGCTWIVLVAGAVALCGCVERDDRPSGEPNSPAAGPRGDSAAGERGSALAGGGGEIISMDYAPPQLIHKVEPVAAESLLGAVQDTVVSVLIEIDTTGAVVAATPLEGDSLLFEAALHAIRQWRFRPYGWPDRKMRASVAVPVVFKRSPPN
jgi:hypothetical protein